MQQKDLSRRRFALLAGTVSAGRIATALPVGLSAQNVIQRIQTGLGGQWPPPGADGFKAGDPATPVTGIATTAMATLQVLKEAVRDGANLVLTCEPTFFGRADGPAPATSGPGRGPSGLSADDPVYKAKREFIEKNGLVVYRLHDAWNALRRDDNVTGLAESLGWAHRRVNNGDICEIPASNAEDVVASIRGKLNLRGGLRAAGDRQARIRRVLLYPGFMPAATMWQRYSEVDLIVAGEVREWENTHYAADIYTAGEQRALVTIGRIVSEDPGMRVAAAWLKTLVKDVPARWIPAGDPYWRAV